MSVPASDDGPTFIDFGAIEYPPLKDEAWLFKQRADGAGGEQLEPEEIALEWQRLSEIEARSIEFLDRPLWQASAFHLLAARKGAGKGTVLADLAARVTRGELGERRGVAWIGSEDSASIDVKPRILAAGGDSERVGLITEWLQLPRDIERLGVTLSDIGGVGLVVIDPLGNHIAGKNANSDTDIRDAIAPLNGLADEHSTMLVGVRHLSEKEAKAGAIAAILGASAWVQIPRAVLAIALDAESEDEARHIQCLAGNRLPPETSGRAFRIEGIRLPGLTEDVTRAVWLGDSSVSVESLLARVPDAPRQRVPAADVRAVVLEALATGEKSREYLDTVCRDELGVNPDTVYKSGLKPLRDSGEAATRKGHGPDAPWYWRLSNEELEL